MTKSVALAALMLLLGSPAVSRAQSPSPHIGLRASGYVTMPVLVNRGALTGVGKEGGYAFRYRPGIVGDVLLDYRPRGKDGKWTFSSGLGIWWWSYRVAVRRDLVPGGLSYFPSEGAGAIALQVPLRAAYRLHPAVDMSAGVAFTKHLDDDGDGMSVTGNATDRVSLQVISVYRSGQYTSLTGDITLSFRASKHIGFSLRGMIDSKPSSPVSVTSVVTSGAFSRTYMYAGAPRFFLYCFGMNYTVF